MAKVPATQLSLEYLRKQGMIVDVCERIIPSKPFPKRHDLFNLFDLAAIPDRSDGRYYANNIRLLLVQTTSATNRASRRKKMEIEGAKVLSRLTGPGSHDIACVLLTWKKRGASYEVKWEEVDNVEYGSDQKDHVIISERSCRSMKEVREAWRKERPEGKERE